MYIFSASFLVLSSTFTKKALVHARKTGGGSCVGWTVQILRAGKNAEKTASEELIYLELS